MARQNWRIMYGTRSLWMCVCVCLTVFGYHRGSGKSMGTIALEPRRPAHTKRASDCSGYAGNDFAYRRVSVFMSAEASGMTLLSPRARARSLTTVSKLMNVRNHRAAVHSFHEMLVNHIVALRSILRTVKACSNDWMCKRISCRGLFGNLRVKSAAAAAHTLTCYWVTD